jgi:site-specific DNA recombinase
MSQFSKLSLEKPQEEIMSNEMKKVAIYARVSSERQAEKDLSIPAQIKALKKFAMDRGWEVISEYIDEAESARTANRPAFQEMIEAAKKKETPFNVILVWKLSRFARNREDSILYKSLLKKRGVSVVSINEQVDESPAGQLLEGIIEVIDEFYSSNLAQDTIRGMKENIGRGFYNGGHAPLGYKKVKVLVGEAEKTKLAPLETEAPIIHRVFQLALERKGCKEIAKELNANGIRTRTGGYFSSSAINHILNNEVYTGILVWRSNKGSGLSINSETVDIVRSPSSHPPLVSKEDFEKIQKMLESRRPEEQHPRITSSQYLLSGLLRCGKCGTAMHGCWAKSGQFFYYECGQHHKKGKDVCNSRLMGKEKLEGFVLEKLKEDLLTEKNISELVSLANEEIKTNSSIFIKQQSQIELELAQAENRLNTLYSALETGKIELEDLAPRIKQVRTQIKELQDHKSELTDKIDNNSIPIISHDGVKGYVRSLNELLRSPSFLEQKAFLRSIIKTVRVDEPQVEIEYRLPPEKELTNREGVLSIGGLGSPTRART